MASTGNEGTLSREVVKETIEKSTTLLCDNLCLDDILRTLLAQGGLTRNEVDRIKTNALDADQVDALLKILAKNVSKYKIFMGVLKVARRDLYDDVKTIEDKESGPVKVDPTPPPVLPQPGPKPAVYDVMISYQWDAQARMKLLKSKLEAAGLTVWMDISEIEGHIGDRMAEGVENSRAILLCFSQKYHDSKNCKKEASYADELKKKIIPLKYDKGYKPSGWLGLQLANILYYDVSSDDALDADFGKIVGVIYAIKNE